MTDRADHLALVIDYLTREPPPLVGLTVPEARVQAMLGFHRDRQARARAASEGSPPA